MQIITSLWLSALHSLPNAKVRLPWRPQACSSTIWWNTLTHLAHLPSSRFISGPCADYFSLSSAMPLGPGLSLSSLQLQSDLFSSHLTAVIPSLYLLLFLISDHGRVSAVSHNTKCLRENICYLLLQWWFGIYWFLGTKAHVTLRLGVKGGPQPDKWKHMVQTAETIECQHKDADRGANLLEVQKDR